MTHQKTEKVKSYLFSFITISLIINLFLFILPVPNSYSAQVTLAWDPNTETDLARYRFLHIKSENFVLTLFPLV